MNKKTCSPDTELKKKIDNYWKKNTKGKVVNEKLPDLVGVLEVKPTFYKWD